MAHRKSVRRAVLAVVVLASLLSWPAPARAAGFAIRNQADLLPGVKIQSLSGNGLSAHLGRIASGGPARVEVITSGAVAGGVETTSAVCRRVGGILCVNGDFTECRTCTSAFGGIIHDNSLQRSPVGNHPQLWLGPSGPGAGPLGWSATLEATLTYLVPAPPVLGGLLPSGPPTERVERVSLGLDAVNRGRGANQVVLYTPPWARSTITPNGGDEAVLGGGGPIVGSSVPVNLRAWKGNVGNNAIPGDGMVLSAAGAGTARMRAFWSKAADPAAARRSMVLKTTADRSVEESVGGHPVILANGQTLIGSSRDPFATERHPRTLVGWNPAGELLLMTIDGRQPGHSNGVSLVEAADALRQVGATSGFNLDGGGSTTFVSLPSGGRSPQVLNRPSDGNERRVTNVLAVIPTNPSAVRSVAAAPPATTPPPAPPGPPPPDPASTDGLPARPNATLAPTPPTTVAPTTTVAAAPPAIVAVAPPETVPVDGPPEVFYETAAPFSAAPPAPVPSDPATGVAGAVAGLALAAAATGAVRTARRRRPASPAPAAD